MPLTNFQPYLWWLPWPHYSLPFSQLLWTHAWWYLEELYLYLWSQEISSYRIHPWAMLLCQDRLREWAQLLSRWVHLLSGCLCQHWLPPWERMCWWSMHKPIRTITLTRTLTRTGAHMRNGCRLFVSYLLEVPEQQMCGIWMPIIGWLPTILRLLVRCMLQKVHVLLLESIPAAAPILLPCVAIHALRMSALQLNRQLLRVVRMRSDKRWAQTDKLSQRLLLQKRLHLILLWYAMLVCSCQYQIMQR